MNVISRKIMSRDWTELRPELLHLISKKLGNFSTFIRFRSVCKLWRSASDPADPPRQLPRLLQPATLKKTGSHLKTDYILYCLSSRSTSKTKLPIAYNEDKYHCCKEYVYYKGKIFVYESVKRETSVFDMTTGAKMNIVIPLPTECICVNFFVEAMGDLLVVQFPLPGQGSYPGQCGPDNHQIKVYRLEHTDDFGQCRWTQLNGIGERVLFLDSAPAGFCLSASDFEGFTGNCIYYIWRCKDINGAWRDHRLLRYDMESGTSEELLSHVKFTAKWFIPCLS